MIKWLGNKIIVLRRRWKKTVGWRFKISFKKSLFSMTVVPIIFPFGTPNKQTNKQTKRERSQERRKTEMIDHIKPSSLFPSFNSNLAVLPYCSHTSRVINGGSITTTSKEFWRFKLKSSGKLKS